MSEGEGLEFGRHPMNGRGVNEAVNTRISAQTKALGGERVPELDDLPTLVALREHHARILAERARLEVGQADWDDTAISTDVPCFPRARPSTSSFEALIRSSRPEQRVPITFSFCNHPDKGHSCIPLSCSRMD